MGSSPTHPGLGAADVAAVVAAVETMASAARDDEDGWRRSAVQVLAALVPGARASWREVDEATGQAATVAAPSVRAVGPAPRFRLEVDLAPVDGARVTVVLQRADEPFTERDRTVLDLLCPHLAQGYENVRLRARRAARSSGTASGDALGLTAREAEVLDLVASGATNADIARRLGIRPATVKKHLERIFHRLGVENRTAAAAVAHRPRRTDAQQGVQERR